jgi:hypothetical protein
MQDSLEAELSIYQNIHVEVAEFLEEETPEVNLPEYKIGQCLRRLLGSLLERAAVGGLFSDGAGTGYISHNLCMSGLRRRRRWSVLRV